jgi:crotonobetainyl-CoA:carnitine CoA-transferase CaiB-like acyl-CoA transferase
MASDNIFSGLKVVDLASFIAGPSAAVILSDFGADVIKVEPPHGELWRHANNLPPQPVAEDAYPWHLANRNKRGIALDLKSPSAAQVLEKLVKWADVLIVNTPHPARARLKLEYADVVQWNPRLIYADITGFGDKGPDADLPGFDITSYWARSGLLSMTRDAGAPPTWPVAGSGDNATAVGLYSAIVTALYRRERTGEGAHVTSHCPSTRPGRRGTATDLRRTFRQEDFALQFFRAFRALADSGVLRHSRLDRLEHHVRTDHSSAADRA